MGIILTVVALFPMGAADTFAAERQGFQITVIDDGVRSRYETTARTVERFMAEEDIALGTHDIMDVRMGHRITEPLTIRIQRGFYVPVYIDGEAEQVLVRPGTTAGELMQSQQTEWEIALYFAGDSAMVLEAGERVVFYTWRSEVDIRIEFIPYDTEIVEVTGLSYGVQRIEQYGIVGQIKVEMIVVLIGNVEYSREITGESIIREPIAHTIFHGIGGDLGTLTDTSSPHFVYRERLVMQATAYTAGFCCTGKHPGHPLYGVTASGRMVEHGIVAVDPRIIPLGTRLYVENYGFALAADVGSAIRGMRIDLFMYDLADALRFGRRYVTV